MAEQPKHKPTWFLVLYVLALLGFAIALGTIFGCTSLPPGTYVGSGTCDQCIGPYDVTLSSHRDALLGRP